MVAYIYAKYIHLLGCSCRLRKRLWPAEMALTRSIPPKSLHRSSFWNPDAGSEVLPFGLGPKQGVVPGGSVSRSLKRSTHLYAPIAYDLVESWKITVPLGQAYNNIADPWLKMASREREKRLNFHEFSINVNLPEGCFHWPLAVRWFIMTRRLGPRRRVHWTNPPCSMILVSVHQTNMDSRCCCGPAVCSLPGFFEWILFGSLNYSTSKTQQH